MHREKGLGHVDAGRAPSCIYEPNNLRPGSKQISICTGINGSGVGHSEMATLFTWTFCGSYGSEKSQVFGRSAGNG